MNIDIRVGTGYDVHKFLDHESLDPDKHYITLCGVKIAFEKQLNGHSDSDVALHALTDALLGTRNFGDIGTYFPPSEVEWKGADSAIFVKKALDLITQHNGYISNVDITIIAEAPKILPHRSAMQQRMQHILNIEQNRINIKATTNEHLGFIGRREGIAAIASCCVIYQI